MRWLRANTDIEMRLVLGKGGALLDDYRQVAPTTVVDDVITDALTAVGRRLDRAGRPRLANGIPHVTRARRRHALGAWAHESDLLWVNTLGAATLVMDLPPSAPAVLHTHEMSYALDRIADAESRRLRLNRGCYLERSLAGVRRFVVPSEVTADDVCHRLPVRDRPIDVIPAAPDATPTAALTPGRTELRGRIGIPPEAPVIAACGSLEWRKGADLFVQVAARLRQSGHRSMHFLWIGADRERGPEDYARFETDLRRCRLTEVVHVVPSVPVPQAYIDLCDVFLLPSREDPFPLVAVEAAGLGKPIVCFAGVTGAVELLPGTSGAAVPYLDTEAMARAVSSIACNARAATGTPACHDGGDATRFSMSQVAPRFLETMESALLNRR